MSHILVVDDDPSIRAVIADALADEGYAVRTASNGVEGLLALADALPALVLLDLRMPVMDGWTFARTLHQRGIQLPIVVMTAAQDARQWAQEVGARAYVAKPFDLGELLDVVARVLRERG
ncbi:MAG TPA: response regulator [Roseiflexaceae bacterium]|nr:response regulator [Roseiflexaceae bacterium]